MPAPVEEETVPHVPREQTEPLPRMMGGYRLGEQLGSGGMGEVIAAHDPVMEREVAIKRMRDAHPQPSAIERFVREAKIQARLDHPAIVPVHQLGLDDAGLPYFTMKRLDGVTLAERLAEGGPIEPLLRAFVYACFAIDLAHARGVVHRDLKPSNIMLGNYNDVYVIDWGVARVLENVRPSVPDLAGGSPPLNETAAGVLLGTPGYMAPEQMRAERVGPQADVYALGAILFEILAGETLHRPGKEAFATTLAGHPRSPAARRPDRAIAPELDSACVDALAFEPGDRPTARALAERVQRYLDGDRDLEQRRRLAAEHLGRGRTALAENRRGDAIYHAGRSLALDPESVDAAAMVTSLIVKPPEVLPAEAERELETVELALDKLRARRGALAYMMMWIVVPLLPLVHVRSWPALVVLLAISTGMAAMALFHSRIGAMPLWLVLSGNLVLVTAFSRVAGPFVLSPLVACGIALAVGAHRTLADRPLVAIGWLVTALVLPVGLEAVGILGPTWRFGTDGLESLGTIFDGGNKIDAIAILIGTIVLAIVIGFYTLVMTRTRRHAQRAAQVQAWHLAQLLPRDRRG